MRNPTTTQALSLALSLALAGTLTACGQKGPLYLPQDPAAPAPSSSSATSGVSSTVPRATGGTQPAAPTDVYRESAEPRSTSDEKQHPEQSPDQQADRSNPEQHTEAEAVSK